MVDDDGSTAGEQAYMYQITGHAAAAAGANVTLNLDRPLEKAIAADATGAIIKNPYDGVVLHSTTTNVVGVPQIAVTASYYFWLQVDGIAACTADGTGVSANTVATFTAGVLDVRDADTEQAYAYPLHAIGANDSGFCKLHIGII